VHYVSGYVSIVFSFVTLFFGLHEHAAQWYWFMLLAIWLAFVILAFLIAATVQVVQALLGSNEPDSDEMDEKKADDASQQEPAEEDWDDES
jgi:NADH:ubiquinone oxidoreductase subunit 6 (subunit J)